MKNLGAWIRAAAFGAATALLSTTAPAQQSTSAEASMNELGPENAALAQRTGIWDVELTSRASIDAVAVTTRLVAERTMVGSILQEIIRPLPGAAGPDFQRIDYLTFNRIEGSWKYVSMDTRAPVGPMPARSFGRGEAGRITLVFEPFATAGSGTVVTGQMLSMNQVIIEQGSDRDVKEQRFMLADGSGRSWLGNRYAYTRRAR